MVAAIAPSSVKAGTPRNRTHLSHIRKEQIKKNESVMGSTAMTYDLSEEKLMKLKYKSQHGDSEASFRLYQYYCFTKNNIDIVLSLHVKPTQKNSCIL